MRKNEMSVEKDIEKQLENLEKFVSNPRFREKTVERLYKDEDRAYERRIKDLQKEKQNLEKDREDEVQRLVNARWQEVVKDKVYANFIEGKVNINGKTVFFSSIKDAALNMRQSFRTETDGSTTTRQRPNRWAEAGGRIRYGETGGLVSRVGLAKSKTKIDVDTEEVAQCYHLGVNVSIDGIVSEVILLNKQVDQDSRKFNNAYNQAQRLIAELGRLANTPVPASYPLIENEPSVVNYTKSIEAKTHEIEMAINDKPKYEIPKEYRTKEQAEMTDKDYLDYLDSMNGLQREKEIMEAREERLEKEVFMKNAEKEAKIMRGEKTTGEKVGSVILWIVDVMLVLLGLIFLMVGGYLFTLVTIIVAVASNPIFYNKVNKYDYRYPFWVNYIILVVGIVLSFVALLLQFAELKETADTAMIILPMISHLI
jgi:hypothetical protein